MLQKTALVTGAGSGLGQGIARELVKEGYDLAIHTATNEARARELASKLSERSGRRVEVICSNFMEQDGARKLFEEFRERFERLDLFVNNAGVTMGGRILDIKEETFDTVNSINWRSAYLCVQQAARMMVEGQTRGNMVLISSNHHAMVLGGNSSYSIAKESLVKLTKHAAIELARYGIRVHCIAPGWVDTGEERMQGYYDDSVGAIPLHRWVKPEEIAQWILFLTGPAAASLTGDTIELDGGVRLMSGDPKNYNL